LRGFHAVEFDHRVMASTSAKRHSDYVVHAAWPLLRKKRSSGVHRAAQQEETAMQIHPMLRLACLAAVLAGGFVTMAYEAKAGGLKGGANTASPGTHSNPVKGSPTVIDPGPARIGPPPPPGKGGCPKGGCKH
jgi:hypothetical protein